MKSLQLQKPHVLVVVGLPGAGKSFFASQFSDAFSAPYLDYRQYRSVVGDDKVANELATHTLAQLFRTKQTIVLEGVGTRYDERVEIIRVAKKNGYDVLFIWVQTEPQAAMNRATSSKGSSITEDDFIRQAKQFEIFRRAEPYVVISGKHTHSSQAKAVLKKLVADRPTATQTVQRIVPTRGRIMG